jgi:hypothetical protein
MKKVIAVIIVLAVCAVGFGFYRGWFALSTPSPAAGSNEVNVNLATDTDKMKEDAKTVKDKAAELTGSATDGSDEPANHSTDELPPREGSPEDIPPDGVEPRAVPSDVNE